MPAPISGQDKQYFSSNPPGIVPVPVELRSIQESIQTEFYEHAIASKARQATGKNLTALMRKLDATVSQLNSREDLFVLRDILNVVRQAGGSQILALVGFSELMAEPIPAKIIRPEHAYYLGLAHNKIRMGLNPLISASVLAIVRQGASDLIDAGVGISGFRTFTKLAEKSLAGSFTLDLDYEVCDLAREIEGLYGLNLPEPILKKALSLVSDAPKDQDPCGARMLAALSRCIVRLQSLPESEQGTVFARMVSLVSYMNRHGIGVESVLAELTETVMATGFTELEQSLRDAIGVVLLTGNHMTLKEVIRDYARLSAVSTFPQLIEKYNHALHIECLQGSSSNARRGIVRVASAVLMAGARDESRKEHGRALVQQERIDPEALLLSANELRNLSKYIDNQLRFDSSMRRFGGVYSSRNQSNRRPLKLSDEPTAGRHSEKVDEQQDFVAPIQEVYDHWRRVIDGYFGFGALLYEARRPPGGELALLTRFGAELGEVKYVNSSNPNSFPGKGVALRSFALERIFAPDSAKPDDPFHLYKKVWPGYADEIDDFANAEFILTRGMMLISCRDSERYSLLVDWDSAPFKYEQHSLAIFNNHFGDPKCVMACLVPTRIVAKLFARSLEPFEDFRGFNPERPDLSDLTPAPEALIAAAGEESVVMLGDPLGWQNARGQSLLERWGGYYSDLAKHNRAIKVWDTAFRRQENYPEDLRFFLEYLETPFSLSFQTEFELHQRALELERRRPIIDREFASFEAARSVSTRLLNLFDLFRIAQSHWHRGYTLPKPEDGAASFEVVSEQDQERAVYVNPGSMRMLRTALEFHSIKASDPAAGPEKFPILCSCDALSYMSSPDGEVMLDTYTMTLTFKGQKVKIGDPELTFEDEIFWSSTVVPALADSVGRIRDLRFYDRRAFDHEDLGINK